MASISERFAARLGIGLPYAPTWVVLREVEKPTAPAASASSTVSTMRATSSVVASRSVASSPMMKNRNAVWPMRAETFARVGVRANVSRYSGKLSNSQRTPASRASSGMPSTFSSTRRIVERCSGRAGASPKPQLPITTVVTPCHVDGVRSGSHRTWAS